MFWDFQLHEEVRCPRAVADVAEDIGEDVAMDISGDAVKGVSEDVVEATG